MLQNEIINLLVPFTWNLDDYEESVTDERRVVNESDIQKTQY